MLIHVNLEFKSSLYSRFAERPHRLLVNAPRRLAGKGGDPVVELQKNFGGGKTRSMLALYHLFSADRASDLAGIEPVLAEAAVEQVPRTRIAVLVGTALSPGQTHEKARGGGALFGGAVPCLVLIDESLAHARRAAADGKGSSRADNPSLGRFSASGRVTRAVFLGSATTFQTEHHRIEDAQVRLS